MIRYVYADELHQHPFLQDSMFKDRAAQFRERQRWAVSVDSRGWEQDEYDFLNPLYIIWEDQAGRHAGSMRCLPTTGRTMVNEHFLYLTHGVRIESPLIWECTRFCLAEASSPVVAGGLLLACLEAARRFGVQQAVGVFDVRMPRIYRRLGHSPEVIGTSGDDQNAISVGIWTVTDRAYAEVSQRTGIPCSTIEAWFYNSFGLRSEPLVAAA
jgi:acyl homoserine lactone synthase